jgi:hypothetical protein
MTVRLRIVAATFACGVALAALAFVSEPVRANDAPPVGSASADAEWSARLLLEQARIERSRKRLDEANVAYATAVASEKADAAVARLAAERDAAASAFEDARRAFPKLVEQARAAGVSAEILRPYRFALSREDAS